MFFKRIVFIVLALCLSLISSFAQNVKEPDFIGEIYLLTSDSTFISLQKTAATIQAKSNGLSMLVPLATQVKSHMVIKGSKAETRIKKDDNPVQLIVRCKNNDYEATNIISLLPFEVKKKERRYLMNKVSILGGSSVESMEGLPFKFEKYGESSYKIILENMEVGEYGIMVSEGDNSPSSFFGFRCFGID